METNTTQREPVATSDPRAPLSPYGTSSNLKWGAIFGGGVAALAIASMLYALGLALGLSWIDPNDPGSLRPSGIFSAIWMIVVSLVALFVGGYVAARGAGALSRGPGALHGLVMWGLSVVAGVWLLGNVASAVVRGGAALGGAAMNAVSGPIQSVSQLRALPAHFGMDSEDLLMPINQRLRQQGKPEVTAQQVESATQHVIQRSLRDGQLDRETLVQALAVNTSLSQADAEQLAADAQMRFQTARADVDQRLSNVSRTALEAAEDSSAAFWALFGALLLGLAAAVGGSVVASDRGRRFTSSTAPRHASAI